MYHCKTVLGGPPRTLPVKGLRPLVLKTSRRQECWPRDALDSCMVIWKTQCRQLRVPCRAQDDAGASVTVDESKAQALSDSFVAACDLESVPKGSRKEVVVDGKLILLFWYRNELRACEARSPAEGAYSIGFMGSRFTEDYGIECPTTKSVFSIKTGEILEWYPNNPVLRFLIPTDTCRPLEIYPVQIVDGTVYISFKEGTQGGVQTMGNKGGVNTSLEGNNVFYLEPKMYVEGSTPESVSGRSAADTKGLNPVTVVVGTFAAAIVAVAGTGLAVYNESVPGLIAFWIVGFAAAFFIVNRYTNIFGNKGESKQNAE